MRKLGIPLFALMAGALFLGCPDDNPTPEAVCGDGVLAATEQCDDGNLDSGDGCEASCTPTPAACGDKKLDPNEECDDGNSVAGDGCEPDCKTTAPVTCGNKKVDPGEECDDGNDVAGDGCEPNCKATKPATCGDKKVDEGEECDDGNSVPGDGCENNCKNTPAPRCGDKKTDPGEECDDGNDVEGDGCEPDCKRTPGFEYEIVTCAALPATTSGKTCDVTAGSAKLLIKGDVLLPGKVLRGGQVVVDNGKIACVDCDCSASASGATVMSCPDAVVSPGLINSHDHITYAHNAPYAAPEAKKDERYEHRHDWRRGLRGHTQIDVKSGASADQVRWGELRFVVGGATSTVGSGGQTGFLRNLDKDNTLQEGLGQTSVDFETFPLGDSSGTLLNGSCSYASIKVPGSSVDAYLPHIGEGIDAEAHNEFLCTEGTDLGGKDAMTNKSAYIHGIAVVPPDVLWMSRDDAKLVWSPRSNVSLYGDTAPVALYARAGAVIALGTDWMPSGSMNMLRELKCARDLSDVYYDGYFSDMDLWAMVTGNAAVATATDDAIGFLKQGLVADVALFAKNGRTDYQAVVDAEVQDVALVLRGGKVLYGDANVVEALPDSSACEALSDCLAEKKACVSREAGKNLAALKSSGGQDYPLFYCSAPANEPSCVPFRATSVKGSNKYTGVPSATDRDGDGIADAQDNCPAIFNPIRPMDGGKQSDFDFDGKGDPCDPCPMDKSTDNGCAAFDPADYDGDGIASAQDKCPYVQDDQKDSDSDGKGDACDRCPSVANPGAEACPMTVYDIKKGIIGVGEVVAIKGAVVTGAATPGYFVQVQTGDANYNGAEYSGIYVYGSNHGMAVGDVVDITKGTVAVFYGTIELTGATAVKKGTATPPPAAVVDPALVKTGGAKAAAYEGVLVKVENVEVTNAAPTPDPSDKTEPRNEFEVTGGLRVNDLFYAVTPAPVVGDKYVSITGVLNWRNNNSKLEPRSAADLVTTVQVSAIEPAASFARVGVTGSTFPTALEVVLAKAMSSDVDVVVESGSAADLEVVGNKVTIPAGQTRKAITVKGLQAKGSVTLTADPGGAAKTATVRVLGADEQPATLTLTAEPATGKAGDKVVMTLAGDVPAAPGGFEVAITASPEAGAQVPAKVTIPADQLKTTFEVILGAVEQDVTITATAGAKTASAKIAVTGGLATLSAMDPTSAYLRVGAADAATFPSPVTVKIAGAVQVPTEIGITSSDPTSLEVVGGKVTIPAGETSAVVKLNGKAKAEKVTLTATYRGVSKTADVRVLAVDEKPTALIILPDEVTVKVGGQQSFTVMSDIPAPAGGLAVAITLDPATAGTVPSSVTILENTDNATFTFTAGSSEVEVLLGVAHEALDDAALITISGGTGVLGAFGPTGAYARVGQQGPTFPAALTVTLAEAVQVDTKVTVTSGDPAKLEVVSGELVVPAGQTSAKVVVKGVAAGKVTLSAKTGSDAAKTAEVNVLGLADVPTMIIITGPATAKVGEEIELSVVSDLPAATGGLVVNLAADPTTAGTLPPSVTIPENQDTATFKFKAGASEVAKVTVTASAEGAGSDSTDVAIAGGLPVLAAFEPAFAYARVGVEGATFPEALTVKIAEKVLIDSVVTLTPDDAAALEVSGGKVVIPAGELSKALSVKGLVAKGEVVLTAKLGTVEKTAKVRVLGATEQPATVKLTPAAANVDIGKKVAVALEIDIPAPPAGAIFDLTVTPATAGEVPATVTVAAGEKTASFELTGKAAGDAAVKAVLQGGTVEATATIAVKDPTTGGTLIISEYVEGSSNNKAIEVYNASGAPVDLTKCKLRNYSNGNTTPSSSYTFTTATALEPGKALAVCHASASATLKAKCGETDPNTTATAIGFNGNDALELICGTTSLDFFGKVGEDPGTAGWKSADGSVSTVDRTLRRKCGIVAGDTNKGDAFDPAAQYDGLAKDTFDGLGTHTVACP